MNTTKARIKERYYSRWACPRCKREFTRLLTRKNHRLIDKRSGIYFGNKYARDLKLREPSNCPNRHCGYHGNFVYKGTETHRVVI